MAGILGVRDVEGLVGRLGQIKNLIAKRRQAAEGSANEVETDE